MNTPRRLFVLPAGLSAVRLAQVQRRARQLGAIVVNDYDQSHVTDIFAGQPTPEAFRTVWAKTLGMTYALPTQPQRVWQLRLLEVSPNESNSTSEGKVKITQSIF